MKARDRVIVALDIEPGKAQWLAKQLTGVVSTLKIPVLGRISTQTINLLRTDFSIMLDLRCVADPHTLEAQLKYLEFFDPQMITVMAFSGIKSMEFMRKYFQNVEIVAVLGLDLFDEREFYRVFNSDQSVVATNLANLALEAGINSLVCTPNEFKILRHNHDMGAIKFYVKNVVPGWAKENGIDSQNIITPEKAVHAAVSRMIVRSPIISSDDPRSAANAVIEEIHQAQKKVSRRKTLNIDLITSKRIR